MPSEADKLEYFTSVITNDALDESKKILEEVQRESDHVLSMAEDEYLTETFRYIKQEIGQIKTDAGRRVSHKVMEGKRALYLRREEMSAEVVAEVRGRIERYVKTPAYEEDLRGLLERALAVFGPAEEIIVQLRQEDMRLAPALQKAAGTSPIRFEQGSFELGGLTVSCPRKHRQIDESFDTTLGELRAHFAEMFGLELAN